MAGSSEIGRWINEFDSDLSDGSDVDYAQLLGEDDHDSFEDEIIHPMPNQASNNDVNIRNVNVGLDVNIVNGGDNNYDSDVDMHPATLNNHDNDEVLLVENEGMVQVQRDRPRTRVRRPTEPNIEWETMETHSPVRETFIGQPGPKIPIISPVDIFEFYFDRQIMEEITKFTNLYAEQERNKKGMIFPRRSRDWDWQPVTVDELYLYFSLLMLMGIVQKPSVKSYYSKNSLLESPIFPSTMPLERFQLISKYLHFCDNQNIAQYSGPKSLFKIFSVIKHLNQKFKDSYGLSQNVSIDESLTLWKGRLNFRQYIPLKAS